MSVGGFDLFQIYIYNDNVLSWLNSKDLGRSWQKWKAKEKGNIIGEHHIQGSQANQGKPHNSTGEDMLN